MEIKILHVFLGADGLPYKDQARTVHYPITGNGFQGANNTTQIKFYFSPLGNSNVSWVAVSKLPNGKIGSKVLQTYDDSELGEPYALLELDSFYTQYKGDVFIALQGYEGGVNVSYNSETELYEISGTPTIQATGSIKFTNNYAPQFVGSGEEENADLQSLMAALGLKANASETFTRYTSAFGSVTLQTLYNKFGYNIFLLNTGGTTNIDYLMQFQVSSGALSGVTLIRLTDLRKWYATLGLGGQLTLSNYVSDLATNTYLTHITTEEYANDIVDELRTYIAINYATKTYVDDQDDAIKNYVDTQDNSLKTYVDTQDATKLDKVTTTSYALRLYAVSSAGVQQMLNVGENALDIPQRKYNKQINVPLIPSSPDDATSKSYVDSKVSALGSALIYMGSKTVAQLNALTNIETGDFYNVSDSGTLTQGNIQVNQGDNVAWDGSKWDKLSSDIDLSAYYNKNEIDDLLDTKQDTLVSGTNIKSINNQSLLGSGDITIQAGAIEKTGAELEDMTYVEGQLYYCTSDSESFSADTLYMATGENTIVRFTQTTVNTNPAITAFSISPTSTEFGNTRTCTYSYTLKKYSAISDLKLDGTVISAQPSSASGSGTATTAYDNHTFTLTGTYSGGTLSRTATISPIYRQFYGVVSGDTVAQVLANLKDVQTDTSSLKTVLSNTLPSSVSLSLGSTPVYVYFVVRSNLSINTLKSGGFDVPYSLIDTQTFTNHYNASYSVRVYRTDNKVFGDMVVNINS